MSTFTTFAVAGVGRLGKAILKHLVAQPGVKVIVLTRPASGKVFPAGVEVREVDYANETSLINALTGVQVVVSTLSGAGFGAQPALVEAVKKAGIKLFVPSEFGMRTTGQTTGLLSVKNAVQERLKALGLPFALFFTGAFTDMIFPVVGFDFANGTARIIGDGNAPVSFTTVDDIGRYTAYVLTHVPISSLEWSVHGPEGDRKTLNEAVALFEKVKGKKFTVTYRDLAQLQEELGPNPPLDRIADYLGVKFAEGIAHAGNGNTNHLFPEFNPKNLENSIAEFY